MSHSTAPVALAVLLAAVPCRAMGEQAVNPIHPLFAPLAADGRIAARPEDVSADRTCGACHDARHVAAHRSHARAGARATCIDCHADGPLAVHRLEDGKLRREDVRVGRPRAARCAACHGVVSDGSAPVALPGDLEAPSAPGARIPSLTVGEGAIVAPQRMSDSFLDLAGKASLTQPWDVHAAKLVDCVACHHAANDPARTDGKQARLRYVVNDPRRTSTAEFLVRPDHRLAKPDCRSCHAAGDAHRFLPYRERHMEVLACAACHVPGPLAPAAEMIDATVATAAGTPAVRWRNVERRGDEPLNATTLHPLRPLFVLRTEADGARRLAPVNVVGRWRWVSGGDGSEVPFDVVLRAYRDGAGHAPAIVAAFDANRDGRVDAAELRLDEPGKTAIVAARLAGLGVAEPRIEGVLEPHALAHGVAGRDRALRACDACHSEESRLGGAYALAAYVPGGVPPRPPDGGAIDLAGVVGPAPGGGLELRRADGAAPGALHVLGRSRDPLWSALGLAVFAAVLAGVTLHATARLVLRRRRGPTPPAHAEEQEYVFGRYERIWHWVMAASGVALMLTGLVVHLPGDAWPVSLPAAVGLHNAAAVVLIVNAGLSLFHHLVTRAIRHFIPHPHGLLERTLAHLHYQSRGIFQGDPHPHHPGHKLNPLQQVTYLGLLAVLFPLQIATGFVIWTVGHWPAVGAAIGGLRIVAPVHALGAWLFLAFFVLHGYLVTTGPTLGEHLRSMITGYRTVPAPQDLQGAQR